MKDNENHIIYNARAIKNKDPFVCSIAESEVTLTEEEQSIINNFNPSSNVNGIIKYAVELYYETEYNMFQTKRSVLNVAQYVMELHNQVSIMYLNEGIKTPLSKIKIWDVEDPYKSINTKGLLNEFTNHMGKLEGDLGILLTFRSIGGGRASGFYGLSYPGEPFENDISNKIAVAGIYDYFRPVPNYSWSIYVITHEFGHLFGSRHTHSCLWNGEQLTDVKQWKEDVKDL